jgi:predicted TIM-barrel fold metal-dependent hydrolase
MGEELMLSRRDGLKMTAAFAAGLASRPAWAASTASAPSTVKTALKIDIPPGACDCHTHVFPDPARFAANRSFTPPDANAADLLALQKSLHMDHVVIVNSTVYGPTIAPVLETIRELGQERARGIALFDAKLSAAELDDLHGGGIRGIRVFLGLTANVDLSAAVRNLDVAVQQIQGRPWNLQVYGKHQVLAALYKQLSAVPVPLVIDHFAGVDAPEGLQQEGFGEVLDLVKSGRAYVKISGAYYSSSRKPDFADMAALIAANPDRIVWGSDWPHPNSAPTPDRKPADLAPPQDIDDGLVLNQLAVWAPEAAIRHKILIDNPKRLYGF